MTFLSVKANPTNIFKSLTDLKGKMIQELDGLSNGMLSERGKLTKLQEAIKHEQTHLYDLYRINDAAGSLAALIDAHRLEKETFEKQMEQTKLNWQAAKDQLDSEYKEQKDKLEKLRKRDEEEYTYQLEIKRRKELDEYNSKRAEVERELVDRISAIDHRERRCCISGRKKRVQLEIVL